MNCADCYYRGVKYEKVEGFAYASCEYILYTKEPRGCPVKDCNKFLDKKNDRNPQRGCGSCIHKMNDKCMVTKEDVWSYKPSCEKHYKKKEGLISNG